jgi:NAD(P)H-dependent FMN reductase
MDQPHHPRLGQYVHQHTGDWSAKISEANAFVFVMAEYNFGYNAPLKPQSTTCTPSGGTSREFRQLWRCVGGTRAVQMVKQVITAVKMVAAYEAVSIPVRPAVRSPSIAPNHVVVSEAKDVLDELCRMCALLSPLFHLQ